MLATCIYIPRFYLYIIHDCVRRFLSNKFQKSTIANSPYPVSLRTSNYYLAKVLTRRDEDLIIFQTFRERS